MKNRGNICNYVKILIAPHFPCDFFSNPQVTYKCAAVSLQDGPQMPPPPGIRTPEQSLPTLCQGRSVCITSETRL